MMNWLSRKVMLGKIAEGLLIMIVGAFPGFKVEGWMDDAIVWALGLAVMWFVKETEATKARMKTQ